MKSSIITCLCFLYTIKITFTSSLDYYTQVKNSRIPILPKNFFNNHQYIRKLSLTHLEIEELSPGVFNNLDNLQELIVAFNSLQTIHRGVFTTLHQLQILNLSANSISNLEENCFQGLVDLEELFLDRNRIKILPQDLFVTLPKLTILDLSHNPLEEFNEDLSKTKIKTILISGCQLNQMDFAIIPKNFTTLDLSKNHINVAQNWDKLEGDYVTLKQNDLIELECYPQSVFKLCLTYNKISNLENRCWRVKNKLESLDLGFNQLTQVKSQDFVGLDNLKSLNLQNNLLSGLKEGVFVNCPKLKTLDIALNKFRHIDQNVLSCLQRLQKLYITRGHFGLLNSSSIANGTVLYFDHNDDNFLPVKQPIRSYAPDFCKRHPLHFHCRRRPSIQSGVLSS